MDETQIGSGDLLLGFLELWAYCPDLSDWTEERLGNNPPRLIRLRRLLSLFRAFGVPWGPETFIQGRFIDPGDARYNPLLARLAAERPQGAGRGVEPLDIRLWQSPEHLRHQLPRFFEILFGYRKRVADLLAFSSGLFEASGLYWQAHSMASDLNAVIATHVGVIDDILATVISPERAHYSMDQLVRDYGYPDVDLSEIDADWC